MVGETWQGNITKLQACVYIYIYILIGKTERKSNQNSNWNLI